MPCTGVHNVFPDWRWNAFIYSPVYSSLVLTAGGVETATQQSMVDAAGAIVNNIPGGLSYYSRCWSIIGILTLNGDIAKAAVNTGISGPPPAPSPTPPPTSPPVTPAPTTPSPPTPTTSSPTPPPSDDDELDEQIDELVNLIDILMPLLQTLLEIINNFLSPLFF